MSKKHCTIAVSDSGTVSIEDHESTNGTYVDGVRLAPGVAVDVRLGAEIACGLVEASDTRVSCA